MGCLQCTLHGFRLVNQRLRANLEPTDVSRRDIVFLKQILRTKSQKACNEHKSASM